MRRRGFLSVLPAAAFGAARERSCDVLIVGGGLGGVAGALAAAQMGMRVVITEETAWLGGQSTTQGVPLDEHPWIETRGRTASYAEFRRRVRGYYRRNYRLSEAAQADPHFNPGAGWVSACCFEPRVGVAVIEEMLAPLVSAGRVTVLLRHRPVAADRSGDRCRAVTLRDEANGGDVTIAAPFVLDATELGDLLPLAGIEFVTGAEGRKETGEPSADNADPLQMQPLTHLIAVDHLPGEDHTIEKPPGYDRWRPGFTSLVGAAEAKGDEASLRMRRLFAPPSKTYSSSIWNFRRVLCASNFAPGAFPSDITMLMNGNQYRGGPVFAVPGEVSKQRLAEARELSLSLVYFLQTGIEPGYGGKRGYPGIRPRGDVFGTADGLAQYPYIRESRRIRAEFTVLEQHFRTDLHPKGPVLYGDSAGTGGYRIDIHERGRRGQSQTLELQGKHWTQQLPLGALIPRRVENVLAACKNLGVTHVTNGAFRLHPNEWNIGESAGALAAYCVSKKLMPRQVRNTPAILADFQRVLKARGVELQWDKPEIARSYNSVYANVPGWYFGEAALKK